MEIYNKVWNKEMMMNDDNLESNLLTSILLNIHSLYKFCYKLHMSSWRSRWTELYSSCIYEVCCPSGELRELALFILLLLLLLVSQMLLAITVYTEV